MPILQALGPSAGRASPPPQTSRATTARRDVAVPMPTLEWNEEVAHDTAHLYERVRAVIPAVEWPFFAPYVKAINALKRVRNAVILAHNYQTPEIYNCVADFVGDSLQLACEVHERFTADELRHYREGDPSLKIIAHPECPPDVLAEADYTGSTAGMIEWVRNKRPRRVVMVTECSMADNVQAELPDVEFVRPCNLCPHMKRIT